jgi:putative ABC transport system substrate-binding protein
MSTDPFFFGARAQVLALLAQYRLPAIFDFREYPVVGGLMSYGANIAAVYRQVGIYTAKIIGGKIRVIFL